MQNKKKTKLWKGLKNKLSVINKTLIYGKFNKFVEK